MRRGCLILADSHHEMLGSLRKLLAPLFDATLMVADDESLIAAATSARADIIVVDLSLPVDGQVNVARAAQGKIPGYEIHCPEHP